MQDEGYYLDRYVPCKVYQWCRCSEGESTPHLELVTMDLYKRENRIVCMECGRWDGHKRNYMMPFSTTKILYTYGVTEAEFWDNYSYDIQGRLGWMST